MQWTDIFGYHTGEHDEKDLKASAYIGPKNQGMHMWRMTSWVSPPGRLLEVRSMGMANTIDECHRDVDRHLTEIKEKHFSAIPESLISILL